MYKALSPVLVINRERKRRNRAMIELMDYVYVRNHAYIDLYFQGIS